MYFNKPLGGSFHTVHGVLKARILKWFAIPFSKLPSPNYLTIALISHTSKIMLKILQAKLQQYVNHEIPDVQTGFRKDRGTRYQIAKIHWIIKKAREFQKNTSASALLTMPKTDWVDHNKLWKILQEMGLPDHLTCLLRNMYAGQESTVRTAHETTD